jgi:hypothetical protein
MSIEEEIFAIEEGFWLEGERHFLDHLDEQCLLAFPQTGQMHGVYERERIAATASTPGRWRDLRISNRHFLAPAEGVVQISYRADVQRFDGQPYSALIGSTYVRRPDGWKLAAHQHSPL